MAVSYHYFAFAAFAATTLFLHMPQLTSGLHSPNNVKAEAVNGTDFLIISWDFQAEANYSKIYLRSYFNRPLVRGRDTTSAGPTQPFCDGAKCSFCFADQNRNLSCFTFNPGYLFSIKLDLGFDMLVSYKVGACSTNESSSCLDSMWKNYTIPPGAPSAVRNVQARPLSSKSVEVSWTAPNQTRGIIQAYTVYYKASDGQEQNKRFPTEDATSGTITGLQPNTQYTIWMVASTSAKNGERSNETSVTTWPNGYTVETKKCLDFDGSPTSESNVTLSACVQKCNDDSSCKSFDYGRGYNEDGSFQSELNMKGVGQCKRWNAGQTSYNLKSCSYDYYEKDEKDPEPPKGRAASFVPFAFLLSLSVVITMFNVVM